MRISIIGAGVVGKATGVGLHKFGHEVIFYDIAREKLKALEEEGYRVSENLNAIRGFDIHMICVPTHVLDNKMYLMPLESAVKELAKMMVRQNKYQVIVIRSTILPLTTKTKIIPLLQRHCPLRLGEEYGICHNPEFLREAHPLEDFLEPPIIVIGTDDMQSANIMRELYIPFQSALLITTPENAEAIKYFSNVYNTTKISFFNQVYIIAERLGLDHEVISQALTKSSLGVRIPEYYTKGGYPFRGRCLPKDLTAFIAFLEEQRFNPKFFLTVAEINEEMKRIEAKGKKEGRQG